jgi:hypothetical protein
VNDTLFGQFGGLRHEWYDFAQMANGWASVDGFFHGIWPKCRYPVRTGPKAGRFGASPVYVVNGPTANLDLRPGSASARRRLSQRRATRLLMRSCAFAAPKHSRQACADRSRRGPAFTHSTRKCVVPPGGLGEMTRYTHRLGPPHVRCTNAYSLTIRAANTAWPSALALDDFRRPYWSRRTPLEFRMSHAKRDVRLTSTFRHSCHVTTNLDA